MFRAIDSSPEYYLQQSRDFQYLTRILDMWFSGHKYNADAIRHSLDPLSCPEEYLSELSERIGFYPRRHIGNDDLRIILKAFPWMYKYKGSVKAIDIAVRIGLLLNGIDLATENYKIIINNMDVEIYTSRKINTITIGEMFRHIAPLGYTISFSEAKETQAQTNIKYAAEIKTLDVDATWHSQIWGSGDEDDINGGVVNRPYPRLYIGAKSHNEIVNNDWWSDDESDDKHYRGVLQRKEVTSSADGNYVVPADGDYLYLKEEDAGTIAPYEKFIDSEKYPEAVLCMWYENGFNGTQRQWYRVVAIADVPVVDQPEQSVYWFKNILGLVEILAPDNFENDVEETSANSGTEITY